MTLHKLDAYIRKTILATVALVLVVIVTLDVIFALIEELKDLENDYQFIQAIQYVTYTIPRRFYEFLAMAALIGCLLGLGSLASSSEIIIMRAAGISLLRIAWAVIKPVLVIIILGAVLGEFVAPATERLAQTNRAIAQDGPEAVVQAKRGYWHREGQQYIYVNTADAQGQLYGVRVYQLNDDNKLQRDIYAKRAIYRGDQWELRRVISTDFSDEKIILNDLKAEPWQMNLSPELLSIVVMDADDLSARELYDYFGYLDEQGLNSGEYELAFWQKLFQPLAAIALVIVGISFIFGPLRSGTMGFRLFAGVVVALLFKYLQDLLGPASIVYGFTPLIAVLFPIVICFIVGFALLQRIK